MKTCKNCGAQLRDDAKFCVSCGQPAEGSSQSGLKGNLAETFQQDARWGTGDSRTQNSGYQQQNYDSGRQQQAYGGYQPQNGNGGYQPGAGYGGPYGAPYPGMERTSGLAIASLVLGLVGIGTGLLGASSGLASDMAFGSEGLMLLSLIFYTPGILAAILGIAGIVQAGKPGRKGAGMAVAGLVLGIVFTIFWFAMGQIARDTMFWW